MLGLHVIGPELDMVMVSHDRKSALKQRINPISSDYYTSPANVRPFAVVLLNP